jgi:hypothetical protein
MNFKAILVIIMQILSIVALEDWVQLGPTIDVVDNSYSSLSFSLDATILAVGIPPSNGNGRLVVYEYNTSTSNWTQLGQTVHGEAQSDVFGDSIDISSDGTIVAVCAYGKNSNTGQVIVYKYNGTHWNQYGQALNGDAENSYFGQSVSLSSLGDVISIGANGHSQNAIEDGQVNIYKYNGSRWNQRGQALDGDTEKAFFGTSVSLSSDGENLAVGANGYNNNYGQVNIYQYNGTNWIQFGNAINGITPDENSGTSVSLSSDGDIVAIGAHRYYSKRGKVSIYGSTTLDINNTLVDSWVLLGDPIIGDNVDDNFGYSVSLSSDGKTVAIGAYGVNYNLGQAKVYKYIGNQWVQIGKNITGNPGNEQFGDQIALSSDGTTIACNAKTDIEDSRVEIYKYQIIPTQSPTKSPTDSPSNHPTDSPTKSPTDSPSNHPTDSPTLFPTDSPTNVPTRPPATISPTSPPTRPVLTVITDDLSPGALSGIIIGIVVSIMILIVVFVKRSNKANYKLFSSSSSTQTSISLSL